MIRRYAYNRDVLIFATDREVHRVKVLAIAPYPGLKNLMMKLKDEEPDWDLDVKVGDLREGVKLAEQAESEGFDLIISRGGTARMIRESVSLPVIDIPITGYDMLRVLTLVKDYKGKTAIVGFPNIIEAATTVRDLLGLRIQSYTIWQPEEVRDLLIRLRREAIEVILGDVVTVQAAAETGLHGVLITSGKEAVLDAFHRAKETYQLIQAQKAQIRLYQKVWDQDDRGLLILNSSREVVYANPRIRTWLGLEGKKRDEIADLFETHPELRNLTGQGMLVLSSGQTLNVHLLESFQHRVLIFREAGSDQPKIRSRRQNLATFSRVTGQSEQIRETVRCARSLSQSNQPIWIAGEAGTGKETLAQAVHTESGRQGPFVILDGEQLSEASRSEINGAWDLAKKGTLYCKQAERLPSAMIGELLDRWKSPETDKPRLIFSSTTPPLENPSSFVILSLPPLRERTEDLEDLCRLWIADCNSKYGKQIVGLEPALLQLFKEESWPGNLNQLAETLDALVREAQGPHITLDEGKKQLNRTQSLQRRVSKRDDWLKGTLAEIEEKIIRHVLEEEGNNQTKAAKRLGINRTTLWRKLNR